MANDHYTHTPHLSLYLSPLEIQALVEIDTKGIQKSSPDAKLKLQALATCLITEAANLAATYPGMVSAGLCLNVTPLLPIWEQKHFTDTEGETS